MPGRSPLMRQPLPEDSNLIRLGELFSEMQGEQGGARRCSESIVGVTWGGRGWWEWRREEGAEGKRAQGRGGEWVGEEGV